MLLDPPHEDSLGAAEDIHFFSIWKLATVPSMIHSIASSSRRQLVPWLGPV